MAHTNTNTTKEDIQALFPRRFILRPGVAPNRFTCRHPKHARCSCQGAAPTPPTTTSTTTTTTTTTDPALQRIEQSYQKTLVQMLFALRSFPEAAAAVQQILSTAPPHHQPPPQPHA